MQNATQNGKHKIHSGFFCQFLKHMKGKKKSDFLIKKHKTPKTLKPPTKQTNQKEQNPPGTKQQNKQHPEKTAADREKKSVAEEGNMGNSSKLSFHSKTDIRD